MVMQTLIIAFFATVCVSIVAEVTKDIAVAKSEVKIAEYEGKKAEYEATKMIASRFSVYEIERLNKLK